MTLLDPIRLHKGEAGTVDGIWPEVPHVQLEQKNNSVNINVLLNETFYSPFAVLVLISHITRPRFIFFCLFPLTAKLQNSILDLNQLHFLNEECWAIWQNLHCFKTMYIKTVNKRFLQYLIGKDTQCFCWAVYALYSCQLYSSYTSSSDVLAFLSYCLS